MILCLLHVPSFPPFDDQQKMEMNRATVCHLFLQENIRQGEGISKMNEY